ncbi:MAG: nuclear transport factor 2 family protein [Acidimicrobiales bacterium]|jgi:hypothetical protein
MNHDDVHQLVRQWVEAWNAHDLELILSHFTDDVTFASPIAQRIVAGSDGVIVGKEALREYWREGLRLNPDLHFDVEGLYLGVGSVVINYRNQLGRLVCEVLILDGNLVREGYGTYFDDGYTADTSAPSN